MPPKTHVASMNRIIPSKPSARRITGRALIVNAVICCVVVGGRATAWAHPEFNAVTNNRYLKVDLVAGDELRLAYTVMYGQGPAYAERKRADANGDGKLDDAEARVLGEGLRSAVATGLKIELDGKPVTPSFDAPVVGLAGPEVGPSAFSVDLIAHVGAPGGPPHTVVLDDNTVLAELGETEIRVEESPATRLLESHRGRGAGPREARILFRGPKFSALEDRSITIRFEAGPQPAAPPAAQKLPVQRVALLVIVGLAVVGVLLALRRYRNMKG
jgi:hypothetical protein